MTQLRIESSLSRPLDASVDTLPPSTTGNEFALPRFNLKKRTISGDECERMNLPTVNSAFLSGLFADVADIAKVQVDSASPQDSDPRLDVSKPCKKTRLTESKSMARCGKSFKTLSEAETDTLLKSPTAVSTDYFFPSSAAPNSIEREDSLQYQLSCVTESSTTDVIGVSEAVNVEFPLLTTASTSDRACLPRKVSSLQMHEDQDAPKECYGWFVEMDNDVPSTTETYSSTSSRGLTFYPSTAPEAANYDAEVEWARAADTVDDVLGDFF
jgi:hypothetical protein